MKGKVEVEEKVEEIVDKSMKMEEVEIKEGNRGIGRDGGKRKWCQ